MLTQSFLFLIDNLPNLVLNDGPFGNALAVSFFRRCARLRSRAYVFHSSIQNRCGKLERQVPFNESHVLYSERSLDKVLSNTNCHPCDWISNLHLFNAKYPSLNSLWFSRPSLAFFFPSSSETETDQRSPKADRFSAFFSALF